MKQEVKKALEAPLMRITVDEVLDEHLARLRVAPVKNDVSQLTLDDIDNFDDEEEILVTPSNLSTLLNLKGQTLRAAVGAVGGEAIGGKTGEARLWRGLKEGQVFMVGKFAVDPVPEVEVPDTKATPREAISRVGKGARQLMRIDRIDEVKNRGKLLYAKALTARKGGPNGQYQGQ